MFMKMLISGPVRIVVIHYGDLRIILFGDHHKNFEGICTDTLCINGNTMGKDGNCYAMDGAIAKIIQVAAEQNRSDNLFI